MVQWICRHPVRFGGLLAVYFLLHVLVRHHVSGALDYDESEQAFLSQYLQMGYNSQPPLYTWLQRGVFDLFGYAVLSLALLKNLFIWLTYLLVFFAVRHATGQPILGMIASLGMLAIPQVAWESHRDLSHTVATMFVTSLLFYCVVRMGKQSQRSSWWYVLLGVSVGLGGLFKYNFAFVVVAILAAAISLPSFRFALLDRRILWSVSIAAMMVLPHAIWMSENFAIASTKTFATLSEGRSASWLHNLGTGLLSMGGALLGCCVGPALLFGWAFGRGDEKRSSMSNSDCFAHETRQLLERFFLTVGALLLLMVLTGRAVEFEARWFQPFIFLLPAWLTLVYSTEVTRDEKFQRLVMRGAGFVMVGILIAVVARPLSASKRGKYTRLNLPYPAVSGVMKLESGVTPQFIFTRDIRDAGNLRLQFPDAHVVCREAMHLVDLKQVQQQMLTRESEVGQSGFRSPTVWLFTSASSIDDFNELLAWTEDGLPEPDLSFTDPIELEVPYLHGKPEDRKHFWFASLQERQSGSVSSPPVVAAENHVASEPSNKQGIESDVADTSLSR